ncbi:MAG: HD domain-containing protein [Armatimonadota bacterium]
MLPRHTATFDDLSDEKELSRRLLDHRAALRDQWTSDHGGREWGNVHSDLMDCLVRRLLGIAAERSGERTNGIAIIATGGYGQRVVAPYSDIDLTFLVDRDDDPGILREAFRLVMDVLLSGARVKVGYAYRHIDDIGIGGLDHHTQTALLDARFLCGDRALFERFDRLYPDTLHVADFLFRKEFERAKVRARAGESPFVVEPDLKEGAGGLRDFQTALWMAQARFGKSGDALWRDLVRRRILTHEEMRLFRQAREHLYRLRNLLHISAGERRDRLTMARQEDVALRLGYRAEDDRPAVEAFMERHYEAAATISRLAEKVVGRCLDAPLALEDSGLSSLRRHVVATDPAKVQADPAWPIRALAFCQEYELELASATIEAIEQSGVDFTAPEIGRHFISLLGKGGNVHKTLRRAEASGVLGRILPELDRCRRLVPYDPAHAFTVGEHTVRVLGNLMRLLPDATAEAGLEGYRYVFSTLESPDTLYLATLLHDIGKQWPRRLDGSRAPHEVTGAERAPEILQRLGCAERMSQRATFLVRHHLLLAEVSRLRDLSRPETVREVLDQVEDSDLLRMLYLLTWADTSAVGPGTWTTASARLLDELVQRCEAAYGSEESDDPATEARRLDALRDRLRRRLSDSESGPGADAEVVKAHTDAMPIAYLLNTTPEEMALHMDMVRTLESGEADQGVVTDMRGGALERETEITVVAWDDPAPGLLAKITGVLYAFDIRLHAAQVFTRVAKDGSPIVIDTLRVDHRDRGLDRSLRIDLAHALSQVLGRRETVGDLIARRRRPAALVGRSKQMRIQTTSDHFVLVDASFPADTGGVHALCRAITQSGWNIQAARLSAWSGRIRCAVYVEAGSGGAGTLADRETLEHSLLSAN